ncbi:InlB B-repeat-containing protein, partial [Faecalimonas sp.]
MKKKQVVSGLLSAAMVMNVALVDMGPVQAATKTNLALGCSAVASNVEDDNHAAGKAVDGKKETWWGTAQNKNTNENIEVSLKKPTMVKQVKVFFERSDAESNIKKFKVELKKLDGTYHIIKEDNDENKAKQEITIDVGEPVEATKVKVTVMEADGGTNGWKNIGIKEIEVYGEEKDVEAAENTNHMRTAKKIEASTQEASTLGTDKLNDGKYGRQNRWASQENTYENQWVKAELAKPTMVKEMKVKLFNRDVAPSPSNVKGFNLKYTDINGVEKTVKVNNEKETGKEGYKTDLVYRFAEPVCITKIELKDFDVLVKDASSNGYNNISIEELELYSNEQSQTPSENTLDGVIAGLKGGSVEKNVTQFVLPQVPEGFTIKINGADFEQIIAKDGKVQHPLTDKLVKVSFEVSDNKGNSKVTGDYDYAVKGLHEKVEGKNAKPVVIPEIQEWYSNSDKKVSTDSLTKVVYNDAKLKPIVDEFVKDYKDFSGKTLTVSTGTAQANAFNFTLQAPDELLGEEGYKMDIEEDRINVNSVSITGNMYGMQTILQMYKENAKEYKVGQMRDYPRYQTRGLLLDVARKPVSLEMMKEITRTMRYYKMNDFQAHLSDNYIFLEQYGKGEQENESFKAYEAFRLESSLKNAKGESPTAKDYSISKEEFKKFIQEERALGMKVVPEIDVPAHATSFTKVWPELMVKNQVSSLNRNRPLVDHFDLTNPAATKKIEEIFDDYTKGANPTFDGETTVHIGADEFLYSYKDYRKFVNEFVPYVKETNPVRMWGGLTWIKDNPVTQIQPEAIKNVEMNLWSKDWADGKEMYDMGYKLINTIDSYGYMVPNGNFNKGAYGDLLNVNSVFNNFDPNRVIMKNGQAYSVPSGDDQMLGAAFAIWSDNIDKSASGLTESDLYWRFFDALPFYAEKTWAATGKEKETADKLAKLAQDKGTGPNTNPYYQENKKGDNYAEYKFEENLNDTSENKRNLEKGKNAEVENGKLHLKDKESYVTSPIEQLGNGNALSFDIKLDKPSKSGDILFEETALYGTHDIRVMDNGKLGFTRELYDYYFDYELPVGKQVRIQIVVTQQKAKLYVDGQFVSDAKGRFFHNNMVKKDNISNATFALPLERIGSKTDSIEAEIDNVLVTTAPVEKDEYNKATWTGTTNSETKNAGATEGELTKAFDKKANTHWHSNWSGVQDKVEDVNGKKGSHEKIWAEIDFHKGYTINQFSFTPRTDIKSGYVTRASLYVKNSANGEWKLISENQKFANDGSKKTFNFPAQEVFGVKFEATQSSDGWVTVSEFDMANAPQRMCTVFVQAEEGGKVEGNKEVVLGENATVTATANTGYRFAGWYRSNGEKVSDEAKYTFKVTDNTALTAKFEKTDAPVDPETKYTVTVQAADETMGTVSGAGEFNQGENATVTATAKEGYKFVKWTVDGVDVSTEATYTFEVTKNISLIANFEKVEEKPEKPENPDNKPETPDNKPENPDNKPETPDNKP